MMNDDVLGMYAFLLFSPMIMLNLLKRNVAGASRYICCLNKKIMQVANAILAGVILFYQEAMTLCIRVGSTLQRFFFFFCYLLCYPSSSMKYRLLYSQVILVFFFVAFIHSDLQSWLSLLFS